MLNESYLTNILSEVFYVFIAQFSKVIDLHFWSMALPRACWRLPLGGGIFVVTGSRWTGVTLIQPEMILMQRFSFILIFEEYTLFIQTCEQYSEATYTRLKPAMQRVFSVAPPTSTSNLFERVVTSNQLFRLIFKMDVKCMSSVKGYAKNLRVMVVGQLSIIYFNVEFCCSLSFIKVKTWRLWFCQT